MCHCVLILTGVLICLNHLKAQQQAPAAGGGSTPNMSAAVHPATPLNPVATAGGIGHHGVSTGNHSLLWAKTQQLPEEVFRQVC